MNKLAVVSFENPFPPDYGGSMDIYYLLASLYKLGVEIELHFFSKHHEKTSPELNEICSEVHYYPRKMHLWNVFSSTPFVVKSRKNTQLVKSLLNINKPILLEGLHCSDILNYREQFDGNISLRTHNIEHKYYHNLYLSESNIFKKAYYYIEKRRLDKYESILSKADSLYSISLDEKQYFENINPSTIWIPAFHPNEKVSAIPGRGDYCLFHANLSVSENAGAATWLIEKVFCKTEHLLIIAGKQPSPKLIQLISRQNNVELIEDPSENEMTSLVKKAHINVLRVDRPSGIKLKLLNSLFQGRHCIANSAMIEGTELNGLVHVVNSEKDYIDKVNELFKKEFSESEVKFREKLLSVNFSNRSNAQKIINDLEISVKVD